MKVAITIPVYKSSITINEELSFKQACSLLSPYDIYIVAPLKMDISSYKAISKNITFTYFDPKYFSNIAGYNSLMLSSNFYQRFLSYDYLLIYQLDAYIFRDELQEWCNKDYDYVGAPWIEKPPLTKTKPLINLQSLFLNRVGNGGLSLRKVQTFYRITSKYRFLSFLFRKNEDMLWGVVMDYLWIDFKKPMWKEALNFAFELNPQKSFILNNKQLPMGVHAWEKYDPDFWSDKIN